MPIKSIEPKRLYRQIADQIAGLIRRGEYKAGERLPPERKLAGQLGVSRPSVREALIALEVEGYVEVRVGSGIYVTPARSRVARPEMAADSGPFELIGARLLIESECAALAARAATPAQVKGIRAALEKMKRERERGVMPLESDRDFHQRIAEGSGNSALALTVRMLWAQRTGPLFLQLEHHFDTPALWGAAIAEHEAVVEAIESRSPGAARKAMRRHMKMAAKRFSTSWQKGR
jgi:DNA-binding FadR family transcriptional regulator